MKTLSLLNVTLLVAVVSMAFGLALPLNSEVRQFLIRLPAESEIAAYLSTHPDASAPGTSNSSPFGYPFSEFEKTCERIARDLNKASCATGWQRSNFCVVQLDRGDDSNWGYYVNFVLQDTTGSDNTTSICSFLILMDGAAVALDGSGCNLDRDVLEQSQVQYQFNDGSGWNDDP